MIKIAALLLTAFSVTLSCYSQSGESLDVLHYEFQLRLSDSTDRIEGQAGIQFRILNATDEISLDLAAEKDGKGMTVAAVTADNKKLSASQRGNKLVIQLPARANAGDTLLLTIEYSGIPADGLIISKNKYRHRTFFADNWPDRGHNWLPCHDDPADKASVEFIVLAPQHYQVVANGVQTEETNLENNLKLTHWKEEVPVATKVMVIGAADFAVNLAGMVDCIPVYSWVYPEDREKGFYDYAQAKDILPFFISHVGAYGYKKLANVESKTIFGGLENASAIFYSENSITGTRRSESLLTHEIAHQWFGNMATEKSFAHLWLSEGFATYFTILYFENKYGADTAVFMRQQDRREVIAFSKENKHSVVDTSIKDYMQLLNANNYQKGGWILHMLRRQIGDSVFWQSIRDYYATYAGKNAGTGDLKAIFEKHSGLGLEQFFQQWLYSPGQPNLSITWKMGSAKKLQITVSQLQSIPFRFPLEIEIKSASGNTRREKLEITRKAETFTLNTSEAVASLQADPGTDLLFEGKINRAN